MTAEHWIILYLYISGVLLLAFTNEGGLVGRKWTYGNIIFELTWPIVIPVTLGIIFADMLRKER
jgi:hypothetical protein